MMEVEKVDIKWSFWNGQSLTPPVLAFDTETTIVELDKEIPTLVLMTVSDGENTYVIRPHQIVEFISLHRFFDWVGHNVAFDFAAILQALTSSDEWLDMMDNGRFHDTMYEDMLWRLAKVKPKDTFVNRGLAALAKEYCGLELSKENPYRENFENIIGENWDELDKGWFDYASLDAYATYKVFKEIRNRMAGERELRDTTDNYWGPLGERLQVWAAVALTDITRRGIVLDTVQCSILISKIRGELQGITEELRTEYPGVLATYKIKSKKGQFRLTKGSHVPRLNLSVVRDILSKVEKRLGMTMPRTAKTRELKTALKIWEEIAIDDPFVGKWSRMMKQNKLLQFLIKLEGKNEVHPKYRVLVRTGRTSCNGPNIQQIPRDPQFRKLFIARAGYKLVEVDYSFIELRTLAAVCLDRFGESRLAEIIREGIDPHEFTAALLLKRSPYEFHRLKQDDPTFYKNARQSAKALNFGVPGGLGPDKLAKYAKENYGVTLTREEASDFRKKLINDVYPELALYLQQDSATILAHNLGVKKADVLSELGFDDRDVGLMMAAEKVVAGKAVKKNGQPYNRLYVDRIWTGLDTLYDGNDSELLRAISERDAGKYLRGRLFSLPVPTLTGRVRSGTRYTEARNTPFQGLAADGAKVALYRLYRSGYRSVAFIHDAVICEVLSSEAEESAKDIACIMNESMREVLVYDLPVACEWHIGDHWEK